MNVITRDSLFRFGQALSGWRNGRGFSLRGASEFIQSKTGQSVSFTSLGKIESGSQKPDIDTLILFHISGYGGMSLQEMIEFLSGEHIENENGSEFVSAYDAMPFLSGLSVQEKIELARLLLNSAAADCTKQN